MGDAKNGEVAEIRSSQLELGAYKKERGASLAGNVA
jgi:hypothetical protein